MIMTIVILQTSMLYFNIIAVCTCIPLPGLEELSSAPNQGEPVTLTDSAIQNFIKGGADFNTMVNSQKPRTEGKQKTATKMAVTPDSTAVLTMLENMNGIQLLQLLSKALRPQKVVQTVSNNMIKPSEITNIRPSYEAARDKQDSHQVPPLKSGSSGMASPMGTTSRPVHEENNSNVELQGLPDSGRQNTHMKTLPSTDGTVLANIGYENTDKNQVLQTSGTNHLIPSNPPNTNEVDFNHGTEQTNSGVMGGQTLHTSNNIGMFNSAQLYTNPMSMLAAGMGSAGDGSMDNHVSMINSGKQIPNPKETPGFDPNRLMSSWTHTNVFNPEKYNVGQNFVSTDEWRSYAKQPTGYNGLMNTLNQKPMGSNKNNDIRPTTMPTQKDINISLKPFRSQQSMQNMIQGSALTAKMNFIPNNMILPMANSQMPKMNIKFTFDPDRLNSFKGTFHPGQFAPVSNTNRAHSLKFDADTVNQHLMGFAEDAPARQNQPAHIGKDNDRQRHFAIPKYNADSFNTAAMNFRPDIFLGPLSQYFSKKPQHETNRDALGKALLKNSDGKRDLQNDIKEDQNIPSRNVSSHNVTIHQTTASASTPDRMTGVTATPDTPKTTSLENIGGFNPDEANRPIMYNPGMSPGMSFGSFQNFQYNPQQQNIDSNSTGGQSGFTSIGFNPSEVNTAKMSFDVNSQLGIGGGSTHFSGQSFSGGYDPVKTNLMAIQNPFSSTNDSKGSSFTAGTVSGFQSAFIGSFNPNSVNQGMMQNLLNPQTKDNSSSSGYYFGMSMNGFGGSGYGGNFDPSSVNNAVFNPNEVNKVKMHFDPSAMLEKNPGYDTDKALAYKFDPSNINNMQMNFQPSYLQNNKQGSGNETVIFKPKLHTGAKFVPGLLGGGGNNGIPMFNPASVNNAHMNFSPVGINNLPTNPVNITNGNNTTDSPKDTTLFNPNKVNDVKMNFQPDGIVNPGTSRKAVQIGTIFTPGLLTGGKLLPESNKERETRDRSRLLLNNP